MTGHRFTQYIPKDTKQNTFEALLDMFLQLVSMTAGNVAEALSWMSDLDRKYNFTSDAYGMADFINDLKDKGYIKEYQGLGGILNLK